MAYLDSDLKNFHPSTTDWSYNWVNTYKKQAYPNEWWQEKLPSTNYILITRLPMM